MRNVNPNATGKIRCSNCGMSFDDGDVGAIGSRCPACKQGVIAEVE